MKIKPIRKKPLQKNEEQQTNDFHGYSMFNDVLNPSIRTWNRVNTIYNIKEQHGSVLSSRYAQKLGKTALVQIYALMLGIKEKGYEEVRREIFRKSVNV